MGPFEKQVEAAAAQAVATVRVPSGYRLKYSHNTSRFDGDRLAYDVYKLSDNGGEVASIVNTSGYGGRFHVNLNGIRQRYRSEMAGRSHETRMRGIGFDRTPQGDGSLQAAVNDAVKQAERVKEFFGS